MIAITKDRQLTIECPCCGKAINVHLGVLSVTELEECPDQPHDWHSTLTERQISVIEEAKSSGLFDQFCDAVNIAKANAIPRFPERFLITWLNTASTVKKVPREILDKLISRFGGRIDVWAANQIAAILSDGSLQLFIPQGWLQGVAIGGNGQRAVRTNADERQVNDWINTKFGYVAFRGAMFESMRVKSRGDFATVRQR